MKVTLNTCRLMVKHCAVAVGRCQTSRASCQSKHMSWQGREKADTPCTTAVPCCSLAAEATLTSRNNWDFVHNLVRQVPPPNNTFDHMSG